jgi:hypothetical protein
MKKSTHTRHHQQQRITKKTIIIICAVSFCCLVVCAIILFNFIHIERSKAKDNQEEPRVIIVQEQELINDKSIAAPIVTHYVNANSNTLAARRMKVLPQVVSQTQ